MQSDHYVDGFLLAVPGAQKERYLQVASEAARLFKEHGEANPTRFLIARELFRHLERVTDSFEDVANEIDGLVIDHA